MPKVFLTALARSDLVGIWRHVAGENRRAADRLRRRIESMSALYAGRPGIGRMRPELGPDIRSFPIGRYVVFFRPVEGGIELVRVLHSARDIHTLFHPEEN